MFFDKKEKIGEDYMTEPQKAVVKSLNLPKGTWVIFDNDTLIAHSEKQSKVLEQSAQHFKNNNASPASLLFVQLGMPLPTSHVYKAAAAAGSVNDIGDEPVGNIVSCK